jgi:hypothetical protein
MTYADPAANLSAVEAGTGRPISNHAAAGVAVALGSFGVFITSVLYALSPPSAALPAQPFDQSLAHTGAIAGARIMHAAGTVGIFSDIVMMVGVLLVMAELVRRNRGVAAAGWAAIVFSVVVFTFVDAMVGYVLAPVAAMKDGAAAFAGFKHLFDVLFLLGTLAFGAGALLALLNDLGSSAPLVSRSAALAGIFAGCVAVLSAAACFAGFPLEQGAGLSIGLGSAVFTGIGMQIARSR